MTGRPGGLPEAAARWLPRGVIAAVVVLLFSPYVFGGKVFLAADAINAHLPWRDPAAPRPHNALITDPLNHNFAALYNRQVQAGGPAAWHPYILTGVPATEVTGQTGSPGRYSPSKLLLHRAFDTLTATMLVFMLNVLLMGLTMHLFLRAVGAGPLGALFGAVVYMLNGSCLVWLEFESVPGTSALLPLVLYAMERYRGPRPWVAAFGGAAALGALALMGQMQYVLYTALLMLLYAAFLAFRAHRAGEGVRGLARLGGCFAVTVAGGIMIAAVQLLPVAHLMGESSRGARTFDFAGYFATLGRVPWRWLVTLLVPDFFGSPPLGFNLIPRLPTQEYMNYNELCLYMGVPAVFALLAAAVARGTAHSRFFVGLTALVFAWLAGTWLYFPLFAFFPGMDRVNPTRLTFLFVFAFAAAAGFGAGFLDGLERRRRAVYLALAGAVALGVFLLWLFGSDEAVSRFFDREAHALEVPAAALAELRRLRGPDSPVMSLPLLWTLASATLAGAVVLLRGRLRTAAGWLLLAVAVADLVSFGRRYNTVSDPGAVYPPTPAIRFLLGQPGPFRVVQDAGAGLYVNTLAPFGIEEIGGYSSYYPAGTNRVLTAAAFGPAALRGPGFDRWVMFQADSPLFDLLNVRYLLTAPGSRVGHPRYRLALRADLDVYENTAALPRAFVAHAAVRAPGRDEALELLLTPGFPYGGTVVLEQEPDPAFAAAARAPVGAEPVVFEQYAPDEVVVAADLAAPGWLVLTDAWYPGWRARVDGRDAPILRADANYRAVALGAGRHRVSFTFEPAPLALGKALTALGWLLALGGCGVVWWRSRRGASGAVAREG